MNGILLRKMTASDLPQVTQIADECRLSHWSLDDYREEMKREDSSLICAQSGPEIIGFLVGRNVPGQESGLDAEIYNIGVALSHQGNGIGSRLLTEFLSRCEAKRIKCIWLEVRSTNKTARRFYERHGFQMVSIRPDFYSNPTEDAVLMRKELGTAERNLVLDN
jgi:ribosomal-protein-alanine N-acetyltransferase